MQQQQINQVLFGVEKYGSISPTSITVKELIRVCTALKDMHERKKNNLPVFQETESAVNSQVAKIIAQLTPIFKNIVETLPYMNNMHKEVFNILRHSSGLSVEVPTWFITLFAADSY
jgi:hypothetical protein